MPVRVAILGAGFAGMNVARHLERTMRANELAITIVNRDNYTLFTPMLPEVSSGAIEPRHVAPALRAVLPKSWFELGDISSVDFAGRTVEVKRHRDEGAATLPFDHLVVALGAESSTHGIPGAQEHTFALKTLHDAIVLRDVTITALESAATVTNDADRRSLTTFVVVGGGFTGVEAAGELLAFLRSASRFYPRIETRDIRVVLVAGSHRLLEQLSESLGELARAMLAKRGVEIVLDDRVAAVAAGGITLASGKRFESRCVVWSAGVRPAPFAAQLDIPHSPHRAIAVNSDLSVVDTPGVWALGDCARVPKPNGGSYPQTAQHAVHQASSLARNLLATIRGRKTKPYAYRDLGMMASLGAREGLAEIRGGPTLHGLPGWLLWRSYYLFALPGMDRRTRVLLDWALTLPFPKDIASVR